MRGYKAVTYSGHSDPAAETLCFPNIDLLVLFLLTAEQQQQKKMWKSVPFWLQSTRGEKDSEPQLAWEEDK